jgi:hypothetical protein
MSVQKQCDAFVPWPGSLLSPLNKNNVILLFTVNLQQSPQFVFFLAAQKLSMSFCQKNLPTKITKKGIKSCDLSIAYNKLYSTIVNCLLSLCLFTLRMVTECLIHIHV